jgi:hypothetical protein
MDIGLETIGSANRVSGDQLPAMANWYSYVCLGRNPLAWPEGKVTAFARPIMS